jgi:oligopeptide/dipeptide ABC transporter ATP-binding protein
MSRPDVVLQVRGLRTEFADTPGRVQAVRDVDLTLGRGEKLAIVGESGSGKSALALSIMGLVQSPGRVVSGEVWLNGRDLRALPERRRRAVRGKEISLIHQDPLGALDPLRRVGDQVIEALRLHDSSLGRRAARARALDLLQEVEIPAAARRIDDYPHQYSGGMRQRVMIAIALAHNPDVVIADEPTTALDVTTQAQVFALLERLVSDRGTAVILITHNLAIVAGFAAAVNVMYAGRFIEQAPVDEIFARPHHPYTQRLLRAVPRPGHQERLEAISGAPPNLAGLGPGCAFLPRCHLARGRPACAAADPEPTRLPASSAGVLVRCHAVAEESMATPGAGT